MSLNKYIKNKKRKNFTWRGIYIVIKDDFLNEEINIMNVLNDLEKTIPSHLLRGVEAVYIGEFDFLKARDMQAMYDNSSIFVTNEQSNEEDIKDDLVHEIAHSVEENFPLQIYGDGLLKNEFLQKRAALLKLLRAEGLPVLSNKYFYETEYNKEFDVFLYRKVGYPLLTSLSVNLFYSPYGATSLREYFANGFEATFYHKDVQRLKNISPKLYEKMIFIMDEENLSNDSKY